MYRGAYFLAAVGKKEDVPSLLKALDLVIVPKPPQESPPNQQARIDASWTMMRTLNYLIERGALPPREPKAPSEFVMFAILLRDNSEFRPEGWEKVVAQGLEHTLPYVRKTVVSTFHSEVTTLKLPVNDDLKKRFLMSFDDPDQEVRKVAYSVAGLRNFDFAVGPMMKALKTTSDKQEYLSTAYGLLAMNKRAECLPILVDRLDESEDLGGTGLYMLRDNVLKNVNGYQSKVTLGSAFAADCKKSWIEFLKANPQILKEPRTIDVTDSAVPIEKLFPEHVFSNRKK